MSWTQQAKSQQRKNGTLSTEESNGAAASSLNSRGLEERGATARFF
jgi:hypothetical protein